jgi:hypothetical protein
MTVLEYYNLVNTGLNGSLSEILFSLKPENLPNALAKAQELEANNQRAYFAYNYFTRSQQNNNNNNKNQQKKPDNPNNYNHNNNLRLNQVNQNPNNNQQAIRNVFAPDQNTVQPPPVPMDIDKSIQMQNKPQYNRNQHNSQPLKREYPPPSTQQQPQKTMRINNLNEEHFLEEEGENSPTSSEQTEN